MVQPEAPDPLTALAVSALLMALVWPLVRASGRARAERLRDLGEDLRYGRIRGFLVLAVVAAVVLATFLERSLRQE